MPTTIDGVTQYGEGERVLCPGVIDRREKPRKAERPNGRREEPRPCRVTLLRVGTDEAVKVWVVAEQEPAPSSPGRPPRPTTHWCPRCEKVIAVKVESTAVVAA